MSAIIITFSLMGLALQYLPFFYFAYLIIEVIRREIRGY